MKHCWPVVHLNNVDSTNNYANALLLKNELITETVITAYSQEYGRGQQGNTWISEPGKNLTFSLVLFTDFLKVEKQFYLSQAISLAIIDFLNKQGIPAKVKWPNDIYAENKKIAGILIENSIMNHSLLHSVIGIGLNVNQETFGNGASNAISMKLLLSQTFALDNLLNELLDLIQVRIDQLKSLRLGQIKNEYLENLYYIGQLKSFLANGIAFNGKIVDVEQTGELAILAEDGRKLKFMFKEVQFIE